MRIKIIGENNCARATRHLLRLAGFAVTDFLPADAVVQGPAAGYAIRIDVAKSLAREGAGGVASDFFSGSVRAADRSASGDGCEAGLTKSAQAEARATGGRATECSTALASSDLSPAALSPNFLPGPDCATQQEMSASGEEADRDERDASSFLPSIAGEAATAGEPRFGGGGEAALVARSDVGRKSKEDRVKPVLHFIHFDSVDSALETAVLRHVAQLAAGPVIVDRPGGVVRSERELRIVAPCSGDAQADEAAAVAIEFGVLRGLLDLVSPDARGDMRWNGAGRKLLRGDEQDGAAAGVSGKNFGAGESREGNSGAARSRRKLWWPFAVVLLGAGLGIWSAARADVAAAPGADAMAMPGAFGRRGFNLRGAGGARIASGAALRSAGFSLRNLALARPQPRWLKPALLAAQGQFATGSGVKITDGTNFLVVDPCQGQTKFYASITQTGNTQLVAGTASKKIYVCSIHVVAAAAADVAVVEGTGSVCATGTAGVSGFGGATAATGWNFAANGGIALGSGESSLGAESTSGDNLCVFNTGSGQVSGGISYVVE